VLMRYRRVCAPNKSAPECALAGAVLVLVDGDGYNTGLG
jgi:hypothetical protein